MPTSQHINNIGSILKILEKEFVIPHTTTTTNLLTILNNKLDKGGYKGTAQELSNEIENIKMIISSDDVNLDTIQEIINKLKEFQNILKSDDENLDTFQEFVNKVKELDDLFIGNRNYYTLNTWHNGTNDAFLHNTLQLLPFTNYVVQTDIPESSDTLANCWASIGETLVENSGINPIFPTKPRVLFTERSGKITVSFRKSDLDNIRSGKYKIWVTRGNKPVDWLPSLEDFSKNIKEETKTEILNSFSEIEFEEQNVLNGNIVLESLKRLYKISTSDDLTITLNSELIDLTKFIRFTLKIDLKEFVSLNFPPYFIFVNGQEPLLKGEYVYDIYTSDNGNKWYAILRWRKTNEKLQIKADDGSLIIVDKKIWYVDGEKPDNSGDGLSWGTAVKDIQEAIDRAESGNEIWIKGKEEGLIYNPTKERDEGIEITKSFILKDYLKIIGGFKGDEVSIYQREMVKHVYDLPLPSGKEDLIIKIPRYRTVLSGKLSEKVKVELLLDGSNCELDGLILTEVSKGIYNKNNIIKNSIIKNFTQIIGGNFYSKFLNCRLINSRECSFLREEFKNCYLKGLHRTSYNLFNSSKVEKCLLENIESDMWKTRISTINSVWIGLTGYTAFNKNTNSTFINCKGIISHDSSVHNSMLINSSKFTCMTYQNNKYYNCIAYNNTGGGFENGTLVNCLSLNNNSNDVGAGAKNCTLINTAVWGNKTIGGVVSNVYNEQEVEHKNSAVEGVVLNGTNNIELSSNNEGDENSPYFEFDAEGNIIGLKAKSALIDKGDASLIDDAFVKVYDIKINPRIDEMSNKVDIGAIEFQK